MATKYIAHFKFDKRLKQTEVPGIDHVRHGFWINDEHQFTLAFDNTYWIPPSSVEFVAKRID